MPTLSLSVIEIIILMLGAITLGITIHFFITSRKSLRDVTSDAAGKVNKELEVWKLKYFNDTEERDHELDKLRRRVNDAEENSHIYSIEAEELRESNKRFQQEIISLKNSGGGGGQELTELRQRLADAEENCNIYTIEADEQRASNKRLQAELDALKKGGQGGGRELENIRKRLEDAEETSRIYSSEAEELRIVNKKLQAELETVRKRAAGPQPANEQLRNKLEEAEEAANLYAAEAEDLRIVNKKLQAEITLLRDMHTQAPAPGAHSDKQGYMDQLRKAQSSLLDHNEKINQLLSQIELVKDNEEKQAEILKLNEELHAKVEELHYQLGQKEKEINNIRQKEHLTTEMNAMLDSAYSEFNVLQSKMQKLEQQVAGSRKLSLDYEELREAHQKLSHDFEEQKSRYNAFADENRQLKMSLTATEDQLREAEFQRLQLQKRVGYLEELNSDMQVMVDANKKLESQLKRIGELESMLNVIAEERDQLMQRKSNPNL